MEQVIGPADTAAALGPEATGSEKTALESEGRNGVFKSLVKADDDITGLVAYSVFKQNELDWLNEFRKAKGREPTDAETESYILGESTPRRLATYRHLADATLSGKGPEVAGHARTGKSLALRPEIANPLGGNSVIAYVAIAVVILIGVYLAVRAGSFR